MDKDYVKISFDKNKMTAFIIGDIDHHSARNMRKRIDTEFAESDANTLCLDMAEVKFMDSSGLGLILGRFSKANATGAAFSVANPSASVKRVLDIAGAGRIINITESKDTERKNETDA